MTLQPTLSFNVSLCAFYVSQNEQFRTKNIPRLPFILGYVFPPEHRSARVQIEP